MKHFNYVENELTRVKIDSIDFDGNKTKYFGLNDLEALETLKNFLEKRILEINRKNAEGLNELRGTK